MNRFGNDWRGITEERCNDARAEMSKARQAIHDNDYASALHHAQLAQALTTEIEAWLESAEL
jgi:hypothetical protein